MKLLNTDQQRPSSLTLRFKRFLPRSLFGRMLLIFILPTFLMLAVATYVFFNRHWYTITQRMANALAGDIAVLITVLEQDPAPSADIAASVKEKLRLLVSFDPKGSLPTHTKSARGPIAVILKHALNERLPYPYVLNMEAAEKTIGIRVGTLKGVYTVLCSEKRVYTPTTSVFIVWMTGSSILLTFVALLFMRNQIRPILRLAAAAEAIGKGRDVPWFKIEGSTEVRQAGTALIIMRDRLKRQIAQRTAMLAGVSHDLRTPLTRMRLQIELMKNSPDTEELSSDITEMEEMLNAYLAFARGEEAETTAPTNLHALLDEIVAAARRQNPNVSLDAPSNVTIIVRRNAIKRCLMNLVGNALRYGQRAVVHASTNEKSVTITIDDDGPGITPNQREEMFRPFTRADESRNQATGGVGLGLTIARDIARAHGGDVILENSDLGGLRARVWLPL